MTWQGVLDIGAVLAALAVIINGWWQRRKVSAEADDSSAGASQKIAEAAAALIDPLRLQISELVAEIAKEKAARQADGARHDAEIAGLKLELAAALKREGEYLAGIAQLTEQIIGLKQDPVWRPSVRKPGTGPLTRKGASE